MNAKRKQKLTIRNDISCVPHLIWMACSVVYGICLLIDVFKCSSTDYRMNLLSPKIRNASNILSIFPCLAVPVHRFVQNEIIIRKTNLKATLVFSICIKCGKSDVLRIRLIIEISNSISHLRLVFDAIVAFQIVCLCSPLCYAAH